MAKKPKEEVLEIIVAIMLGVTALLTAWATWIGSLHGGNQATNYTKSNNLSAEGNSEYNEAAQSLMQDMMLWNDISNARIDYAFAEDKQNEEEMAKLEYKLDQLLSDNCSEALAAAIEWADAQTEYASPFDKEGFVESYFTDALELLHESQALLEEGQRDNANGDAFGLVTVIYSVVLFLLGIVGIFKNIKNREILLIIAAVGIVVATIYMFTIPMPTGFSFASFFKR